MSALTHVAWSACLWDSPLICYWILTSPTCFAPLSASTIAPIWSISTSASLPAKVRPSLLHLFHHFRNKADIFSIALRWLRYTLSSKWPSEDLLTLWYLQNHKKINIYMDFYDEWKSHIGTHLRVLFQAIRRLTQHPKWQFSLHWDLLQKNCMGSGGSSKSLS